MACDDEEQVRVASRRLVKAPDSTMEPHVVSNLDLAPQTMHKVCMFCVYPKPPTRCDGVVVVGGRAPPELRNYFLSEPLLPPRRPHRD